MLPGVSEPQSLQEIHGPTGRCFGCGPQNEQGLRIRSVACGDEVVCTWQGRTAHQAWDGVLNGGIVGVLFDCHSNWTAAYHLWRKHGEGEFPSTVTADFHVKLHRPTPSNEPVTIRARVIESTDRRAVVEADLLASGQVTATCRGTFVSVPPGHPAYHRWSDGMDRFALTTTCALVLDQGDLTHARTDAIVNAANERLLGGGGVDGAIHRAAGPRLLEACRAVAEVRPGVRCPTGEARITPGFDLTARHVVHTVGPIYAGAQASAPLLEAAHRSALELASTSGVSRIAFPAISCGIFGYPLDEAAGIALTAARTFAASFTEIRFVLFGDDTYSAWLAAARGALPG